VRRDDLIIRRPPPGAETWAWEWDGDGWRGEARVGSLWWSAYLSEAAVERWRWEVYGGESRGWLDFGVAAEEGLVAALWSAAARLARHRAAVETERPSGAGGER